MATVFQSTFRTLAKLVIPLFLALACVTEAHAEAKLVRAQPTPDGTNSAPQQIELWFNQSLKNSGNSIAVFPLSELNPLVGEQTNLADGKAGLDPKDPKHLTVAVVPLAPGGYVVEWKASPRDGPVITGRFTFHVRDTSEEISSRR